MAHVVSLMRKMAAETVRRSIDRSAVAIHEAKQATRNSGLASGLAVGARHAFTVVVIFVAEARYWCWSYPLSERRDGFDVLHGTETSSLRLPKDGKTENHEYMPFPSGAVITDALRSLGVDLSEFTFVDLGSGKGRACFVAALLPFRRALGIELDRELVGVAESNGEIFHRKNPSAAPTQFACANVTDYTLPDEPLVVSMFNPFGDATATKVVQRLARQQEAAPRPTFVTCFFYSITGRAERPAGEAALLRADFRLVDEVHPDRFCRYVVYANSEAERLRSKAESDRSI